ncbi:thiol methyltransferase [Rhypophila decipiens]|uniref:Thiol methyltransferase n=1 Tax=Rhypophila decipiens TaxID=261697 RepID=A0AAN7BAZ3_9PEZI|nr:thiol methyltransferase [Rhypophila decipiens]
MSSPNQPPPLPSQGGDPTGTTTPFQKSEEMGRLQSTFESKPFSDHPSAWDSLWNEAYTPWDRGGPSLALKDVILEHADLFPHLLLHQQQEGKETGGTRPKALVPGCGRGHDVLLLSRLGYDAYGLDFSEKALQEARVNEQLLAKEEEEHGQQQDEESRIEPGNVTWVAGDFFDPKVLGGVVENGGNLKFDLVFDYTFFCALPPAGRSNWSTRIHSLVEPKRGRLVCLEWPLHKPPKTGGPPWGVTSEAYLVHLTFPGRAFEYDDENNLLLGDDLATVEGPGMERIARLRPSRTHKAGYDPDGNMVDFISVWRVRDSCC